MTGHQVISVSNAETITSYTNLVAEPVTAPFSLNTADFLLNNNDKSTENTVILSLQHDDNGSKTDTNWSPTSATSTQHLTVNTSKLILFHKFLVTGWSPSRSIDKYSCHFSHCFPTAARF